MIFSRWRPRKAAAEGVASNGLPTELDAECQRALEALDLSVSKKLDRGRVVVFTSTVPGEGVTTLAVALSRYLARNPSNAVLYAPQSARASGELVAGEPRSDVDAGLFDVLLDDVCLEEAVRPSSVDNLRVLSHGEPSRDRPREPAAGRIERVLDEMRARYQYAIFDASTPNESAFAVNLARHADGVFFVVAAGGPQRDDVTQAVGRLKASGANLVGVILNRHLISRKPK